MNDLWNEYKKWLIWRVHFGKRNYKKLINFLHNKEFTWTVYMDKNRAADGLELREEFAKAVKMDDLEFENGCSVLEMLVALAIRMDNEWVGEIDEEHPEVIFWQFLVNLGLDKMDDRHFFLTKTDVKLTQMIERKYDSLGHGGLFPVKMTQKDHRKVEIWSQMMDFIHENYDF